MITTAQLTAFIIFGVAMFFLGAFISAVIHTRGRADGRLIIDNEDYFVAITTKTEKLKTRKRIHLKVIIR